MLLIPKLTTVNDGAFLADDTLLGGYELGGGWLRIDDVKIGKHAFVGNSGMAAPGRKVPEAGPRGGAVRGATAYEGEGGHVVARQPADEAAPLGRRRRPDPHLPAGHPAGVARALVELCRLVPVMLDLAARRWPRSRRSMELWLDVGWWAAAAAQRARPDRRRRARGRRRDGGQVAAGRAVHG